MAELENKMDLEAFAQKVEAIKLEAQKALVGQEQMFDLLLTAYFAGGHVLIEGVPGVAKTLSARLVAALTQAAFKRIQFTPDMMPSDIIGTSVFNPSSATFEYKKGPIFSNLVLIDEINRAPAKTQSALFEVMEEYQVTNDGKLYPMDELFMVLATQNPIEQEGTYRLPEAQLDRFLFKINVGYPNVADETKILELQNSISGFKKLDFIQTIISRDEVINFRKELLHVLVKDSLLRYIAELIGATRKHPSLFLGASPRASLDLLRSSKAFAAIRGRDFVTPDDIQYLLKPIIEHRIQLTPEAELQGVTVREVSQQIIQQVDVPN